MKRNENSVHYVMFSTPSRMVESPICNTFSLRSAVPLGVAPPLDLSDPTPFTRPTNCPLGLGLLGHRGVVDAPASIQANVQ